MTVVFIVYLVIGLAMPVLPLHGYRSPTQVREQQKVEGTKAA